jgi:phenylacetate-coenzyme A ligase PaaK-like adenylate-forming protein
MSRSLLLPAPDDTVPTPSGDVAPAAAALTAFRRAARRLPGYRALLEQHGVIPSDVRDLSEVPYLDKATVFGEGIAHWIDGGRIADASELLTSSGTSGGAFSIGVTSRAEQAELTRIADRALRQMGASETSSTLLVNCLPMGISVPTTLATVATPSVHLEVALETLLAFGLSFDRVVILGEPTFLKELAEMGREVAGAGWLPPRTFIVSGGEWIAESWRSHVSALAGFGRPEMDPASGILISMGAAELGLHCLFETPELRAARRLLVGGGNRAELFDRDPGYAPTLFAYDPERLFLEERVHSSGARTLVATTLTPRLVPLIRYDLGDLADIVPAERLNAHLAAQGSPVRVHASVVAVWGRVAGATGAGWTLRPELVKECLFSTPANAACVSGRFHVQDTGAGPRLHVQLRDGAAPRPGLVGDLEQFLHVVTGRPAHVFLHHHREYPFHLAGDYQHKPRYATASVGSDR